MADENLGGISYEIDLDASRLIAQANKAKSTISGLSSPIGAASKSADGLEKSLDSAGKSADSAGNSMMALSKVAGALTAILSVHQITEYASAWLDVNNKLANAVKANESLADVTSRVFSIAQATKSDLQSTASLYGTLERATRTLGISTDDLSSVITIVNQGLVLSGANTQETAGAILQLSQALSSGSLHGQEFNSISEEGSRLTQALADSMGVTIGQLKIMASQGKLTSDVVINGLLSQGATISQEFNNHTTTLAQSIQMAGNNLTKFFGENATVNTFMTSAGRGLVVLSENIGGLASALSVAAVVMGGRYAGALTLSAAAAVKNTIATMAQARASATAAQGTLLRAQFEERSALALKESAFREVGIAQAQVNSAATATEAAAAQARLSAARLAATDAAVAATGATNRLAMAQEASATASAASSGVISGLAKGALGLIGGPVGVAMTAAAAIFYFKQRSDEAARSANELADGVGNLSDHFKTMSDTQLAASIAKLNQNIPALSSQVDDMQTSYQNATYRVQDLQKEINNFGTGTTRGRQAAEAMQGALDDQAVAAENLAKAQTRLGQTESTIEIGKAQLNGTILQGINLLSRDNAQVGVADGLYRKFGQALDIASTAKERFNSSSLTVNRTADATKFLSQLQDENELLSIADLRQRAVTKARMEFIAAQKDSKDPNQSSYLASTKYQADIQEAGELAGKNYDAQKADQARQTQQKAGVKTAHDQATAEQSVAQKLEQMRQQADLSAVSTQDLTLEQAKLRAEMALGKNATAAQKAQADAYATSIWKQAAALKARNLIPETKENDDYQQKKAQLELLKGQTDSQGNLLISQQQYEAQSEKLAVEHQANLAKIKSGDAVSAQNTAVAQVDPVQQLKNQQTQQMALINQFEQDGLLSHEKALALKQAADTAYQTQMINAQWAIFTQQSQGYQVLGAAIDGFGQSASSAITGVITGSETMNQALSNIGNAVLSSITQSFVDMGMQWVKSAAMGEAANLSAIASVTAAQLAGMAQSLAASVSAAATTLASWAPAAMVAAIGSWGTAAVIGAGAIASAMAISHALSGKRKNGGPVSGSGIYQVGESNQPEIYQASNGSQYMIPGDNGKVISNSNIGSGSSSPTVNVHNYNGSNVQANAYKDQNGQDVIDLILQDQEAGGPISRGFEAKYGITNKATGAL